METETLADQNSYKLAQEAFVSGHNGSSPWTVIIFLLHVPALVLLRKMVYSGSATGHRQEVARVLLDFVVIVVPVTLLSTVLSGIHHVTLALLLLCDAALFVQRSNCVWHVVAAQLTYNGAPQPSSVQYIPHGTLALQILYSQLCADASESEEEHLLPVDGDRPDPADIIPPIAASHQTASEEGHTDDGGGSGKGDHLLPNLRSAMVSVFKGGNMILTCLSILAVDFRAYPRHFAKTEAFGCSLMDVGVGTFIVGSAITSRYSRGIGNQGFAAPAAGQPVLQSFTAHVTQRLLILLLGVGRFVCLRVLNYQVHVSEYGAHWNFFVTLFAVWSIADVCDWLFGAVLRGAARRLESLAPSRAARVAARLLRACVARYKWVLCALAVGVYQTLLLLPCAPYLATCAEIAGGTGVGPLLGEYLLDGSAPRSDLLSANREGFFSVLGYLGLYWASELLARELFYAPFSEFVRETQVGRRRLRRDGAPSLPAATSSSVLGDADGGTSSDANVGAEQPPDVQMAHGWQRETLLERRRGAGSKVEVTNGGRADADADGDGDGDGGHQQPDGPDRARACFHEITMHVALEEGSGVPPRRKAAAADAAAPSAVVRSVTIVAAPEYLASSRRVVARMATLSVLCAAAFAWVSAEVQKPSRRLCNAAYMLFVLLVSLSTLLLCHLVDNIVVIDFSRCSCSLVAITRLLQQQLSGYNPNGLNPPLSSPGRVARTGSVAVAGVLQRPHAHSVYHRAVLQDVLAGNKIALFEYMNRHQLVCFLVANVLTGAVNQSVRTIYCSDEVAVAVLLGYMGTLSAAMWALNRR